MAGPIHRKVPAPVLQAIVLRRDLRLKTAQVLVYASDASIAFIAARARLGQEISLTAEEVAWFCGAQAKVYLRAHSEVALSKVADQAKQAALQIHLIKMERLVKEQKQLFTVCCAVGPASAAQIASVVGQLTVW